jgi:methyl-accepting chemotaxis protein
MKSRLITLFILVGLLPLLIATIFSYVRGRNAMNDIGKTATDTMNRQAETQLQTMRDVSQQRIRDYFERTIKHCVNISSYPFIAETAVDFKAAIKSYRAEHNLNDAEVERLRKELWATYQHDFAQTYKVYAGKEPAGLVERFAKLDPEAVALQHFYITDNPNPMERKFVKDTSLSTTHSCAYGRAHGRIHPAVRRFVESFGYRDLLIVDAESLRVMYSYCKEIDFGTSLREGPFAESSLAAAVREVLEKNKPDEYSFARYEQYFASYDEPASFVASGIYNGGKLVAVAVIQLPLDEVNRIMHVNTSFGKTGQLYLVGPDYRLRSDAYKEAFAGAEKYTVSNSFSKNLLIETEPVKAALEGKWGVGLATSFHNPGEKMLMAWCPVEIVKGTHWAFIAEISEAEALALVKQFGERGREVTHSMMRMNFLILLIALVCIVVVAAVVARRLSTPLLRAAGNLQETVSQISAATTQLAASGTETAASIGETTATVEEIRQTAHVSSEKARGVENAAQQAVQVSATGRRAVTESIEGMYLIQQRMESIADSIVHLSEQCQAIGEIIGTINDLADQSNLLAVNAAIEAAKAGDEGRGFAVVAKEVRNLAEQSKQATAQVKTILSDIQKATTGAVMATEEGGKAVTSGVRQSEETGRAIEELAKSIESAAQAAIQIAATSQQQLIGMDQMAYAMENVNQATHQNVDAARQLEDSAHKLDQLGQGLLALVQGGVRPGGFH